MAQQSAQGLLNRGNAVEPVITKIEKSLKTISFVAL